MVGSERGKRGERERGEGRFLRGCASASPLPQLVGASIKIWKAEERERERNGDSVDVDRRG